MSLKIIATNRIQRNDLATIQREEMPIEALGEASFKQVLESITASQGVRAVEFFEHSQYEIARKSQQINAQYLRLLHKSNQEIHGYSAEGTSVWFDISGASFDILA